MIMRILTAIILLALLSSAPVWVSFLMALVLVFALRSPIPVFFVGMLADLFFGAPLWLNIRGWMTLCAVVVGLLFFFIRARTRPFYVS